MGFSSAEPPFFISATAERQLVLSLLSARMVMVFSKANV